MVAKRHSTEGGWIKEKRPTTVRLRVTAANVKTISLILSASIVGLEALCFVVDIRAALSFAPNAPAWVGR